MKLLFSDGRGFVTVLFWVMFFVNLRELYFVANWLPTVAHNSGLSEQQALIATGMIHIGGIVGTLVLGRLIDRTNPYIVLAVTYLMAGVFVACIGRSTSSAELLMMVTFCAGFCITGGQISTNAMADHHAGDRRRLGPGRRPHRICHRPGGRRHLYRDAVVRPYAFCGGSVTPSCLPAFPS